MLARLATGLLCLALALSNASAQGTVHAAAPQPEWSGEIDLQARLKDVRVEDGQLVVRAPEGERRYAPQEFAAVLERAHQELEQSGWLYKLFNITTPYGIWWVGLGFAGQALFTFRMLLQWWASEKHKRSVVPVAFWWGSLFGGMMLFVYFIWRKDIVGIVGQSTGVFVYARNLILIYRHTPTA